MSPTDMKTRLEESFPSATAIEVMDMTGTENHYQVQIVSEAFEGMSRIQRHKSVMGAFSNELASGEVHALTIKANTQKELS